MSTQTMDTEVPAGWAKLDGYGDEVQGFRAYTNGAEVIICGRPAETEPDDDDRAHNCDQMGCGWDHVLARFTLPRGETDTPASSEADHV